MTRDEAARLLLALHGNWPNTPMDDAVTLTWYSSALERVPFELGLMVVTRLVETEERFPTVAKFHEVRRAIERRNGANDEPRQIVAGPTPSMPKMRRAAAVARLIAAETPDCGDVRRPHLIPKEQRVHHQGESVANCAFCQERLNLSDDELAARLIAAGVE